MPGVGVSVVNVSGGSWDVLVGLGDALGGAVVSGGDGCVEGCVEGLVITVLGVGVGAPTVALVVALSPLLRMTAVAMAQVASTAPAIATTGRQRRSAGQASSP
jgi:hypothetical protein